MIISNEPSGTGAGIGQPCYCKSLGGQHICTEVKDAVNPSHYKSETGLECIDAIEAATFDLKGIEAVDTANVLKYIWRWKQKNGVEDLKKARWYLEHLINHVEKIEKENI